jgi:hypothetical protein
MGLLVVEELEEDIPVGWHAVTVAPTEMLDTHPDGPAGGAPPDPAIDMLKVREFVAMDKRKDELEAELKAVKQRMNGLDAALMEQFSATGTQSMRVDGRTLYLRRDIRCSAKKGMKAQAVAMLKNHGLGDYVEEGFNANSISAWMREEDRAGRPLPEGFTDTMTILEEFHVRVTN